MNQEKIYDAIVECVDTQGRAPTIREIQNMTGIGSTSTIHHHVQQLIMQGKIITENNSERLSRNIRIPGRTPEEVRKQTSVNIAKKLIKTDKLSINEICDICAITREEFVKIKFMMQ